MASESKPLIKDIRMTEHHTKTTNQLAQKIDELSQTMHDTEQFRTLEEQVADMKRRGIDPAKSFAKWDDDEKED